MAYPFVGLDRQRDPWFSRAGGSKTRPYGGNPQMAPLVNVIHGFRGRAGLRPAPTVEIHRWHRGSMIFFVGAGLRPARAMIVYGSHSQSRQAARIGQAGPWLPAVLVKTH